MKKLFTLALSCIGAVLSCTDASAQYYKDIFMDGGCYITSRKDLPAARLLDKSMEIFFCGNTEADSTAQAAKMVGSADDTNGCLLYPDGAPRFRVIYENGGHSGKHGRSLTADGQKRIRDFVAGGGSYIGTCAGAFLSSYGGTDFDKRQDKCISRHDGIHRENFLGIYPASVLRTKHMTKKHWNGSIHTGMTVEPGSPLLQYFDFGGDMYVDSVRHNGGCFITENPEHFAPGTEILMRFDFDKDSILVKKKAFPITGKIVVWSYKKDDATGRIVDCGSHPEGVTFGERLDLFSSFVLYAIDGLGAPRIKGQLKKGKVWMMDKKTEDADPAHTRIGDRQYHHFTVEIPKNAKTLTVTLDCPVKDIDLNLMMSRSGFAFREDSQYQDVTLGGSKNITIPSPEAGLWYIAVECATTVEETMSDGTAVYSGHTEVLNGIPYSIKARWR